MLSTIATILSMIAGLVTIASLTSAFIQRRSQHERSFRECAKALHSKNRMEQDIAAILLRGYFSRKWFIFFSYGRYAQEATNLMVILLRQSIPVDLQKTLADGFSFVQKLDGQDMQYVNMLNVSIKPQSAIDYEITHRQKLKHKRISMRRADFFHAVMQESNINFVDFSGAVFYSALLKGTNFHNCILKDADFRCANIHNVTFDADCILKGAKFSGAIGIDTAMVKQVNGDKVPLRNFLNQDGVFHQRFSEVQYVNESKTLRVFVSKLGAMDAQQTLHYQSVLSILKELDNIKIETIERVHYTSISQLTDVETHLDSCDGCIIFAFEYLHVNAGHIHKNIVGDDCKIVKDGGFASPWLHIETALANSKQMPCMIIYDGDLCRDGMFDDKIVTADKNLFSLPYSDTLSPKTREFTDWIAHVREYHSRYSSRNLM